jgi:hypothetical protein
MYDAYKEYNKIKLILVLMVIEYTEEIVQLVIKTMIQTKDQHCWALLVFSGRTMDEQ